MQRDGETTLGFFAKIPRRVGWLIISGMFDNIALGDLLAYLTARWSRFDPEPVGAPSKWVTLNCYRALSGTGDIYNSER